MFGSTLVEDVERGEAFDRWLGFAEEFHYSGVLKYFGMSFAEWIRLPVNRAKEILDLAKFYAKQEYDMQAKAEKDTQNEVKKMSGIK